MNDTKHNHARHETPQGTLRMEWVELGEGLSGDFDPEDQDDVELLRLDASLEVPVHEYGDHIEDDASYCTRVPVSVRGKTRRALLDMAAKVVMSELDRGVSLDKAMQRVSWIEPKWLTEGPDLP